ncbi:MAG: aldehyde-activating protein [Gammaproteobacteria bacterium]|nr:aldehyde-activating protein [Gammaproteobacteria bacterium]
MPELTGGCHCGNIAVTVLLTAAPEACRPRTCDCDFCRKHGAAWVSDPQGSLRIRIGVGTEVQGYRQGAAIAEMLLCRRCGVLVAALWQGQRLYGVVNATALAANDRFGATVPVSPKQLSAQEKTSRWQSLWFADVEVSGR